MKRLLLITMALLCHFSSAQNTPTTSEWGKKNLERWQQDQRLDSEIGRLESQIYHLKSQKEQNKLTITLQEFQALMQLPMGYCNIIPIESPALTTYHVQTNNKIAELKVYHSNFYEPEVKYLVNLNSQEFKDYGLVFHLSLKAYGHSEYTDMNLSYQVSSNKILWASIKGIECFSKN